MFNGTLKVGNEYELNNGEVWKCYRHDITTKSIGHHVYDDDGCVLGRNKAHPLSVRQCVKGTLADIGVKPGDVVEGVKSGLRYDIGIHKGVLCVGRADMWSPASKAIMEYRLISRAADTTDTPTLFRDMTDAEKGALMVAQHDGAVIELLCNDGSWLPSDSPTWDVSIAYRIKPEPTTETRTLYMGADLKNALVYGSAEDAYKLHYDIIDGVPCNPSFEAVG